MNEVIKLSRREAKPFMGKPNVIRSKRNIDELMTDAEFDAWMDEFLDGPRQPGGINIDGIPSVTPSPPKRKKKKKTLGQQQRDAYKMLSKNNVQKSLFKSKRQAKQSIRQKNKNYQMGLDAKNYNNMHAMGNNYDIQNRYDAQMTQAIRYNKRYSKYGVKRSRY